VSSSAAAEALPSPRPPSKRPRMVASNFSQRQGPGQVRPPVRSPFATLCSEGRFVSVVHWGSERQVAGRCAGTCDDETLQGTGLPSEELKYSMLMHGFAAPGKVLP
jgi:hypothetical protein